MKMQTTPSKEILDKVTKLGWLQSSSAVGIMINKGRTVGLIINRSSVFAKENEYLGVITIRGHKLRKDTIYAFYPFDINFRGELLKQALRILGKKRVRIFLHGIDEVLILGTKRGSIAIAPIMRESNDGIWKYCIKPSKKLAPIVFKELVRRID